MKLRFALVLVFAALLAGCSQQQHEPSQTIILGLKGVTITASPGTPRQVPYSGGVKSAAAALSSALGTASRDHGEDYDWYRWSGLSLKSEHGVVTELSAEKPIVRGFAVRGEGGYRIGDPFPMEGADELCNMTENAPAEYLNQMGGAPQSEGLQLFVTSHTEWTRTIAEITVASHLVVPC